MKTINKNFQVIFVDNKINVHFWKECKNQKETIIHDYLNIDKFIHMINERFDKIKIVKGTKYCGLIIYEFKLVVDKNFSARVAFAIDYDKEIINVVGILHLSNDTYKFEFDNLIKNIYGH